MRDAAAEERAPAAAAERGEPAARCPQPSAARPGEQPKRSVLGAAAAAVMSARAAVTEQPPPAGEGGRQGQAGRPAKAGGGRVPLSSGEKKRRFFNSLPTRISRSRGRGPGGHLLLPHPPPRGCAGGGGGLPARSRSLEVQWRPVRPACTRWERDSSPLCQAIKISGGSWAPGCVASSCGVAATKSRVRSSPFCRGSRGCAAGFAPCCLVPPGWAA